MKLHRSSDVVSILNCSVVFLCAYCAGQSSTSRMVKLGDRGVYLVESGPDRPVVVFESGMGESTETWADVQPKVAVFARTVLYDRAGIGKSDVAKSPRTIQSMAEDLHGMLRAASVPPPYVLVGHSLGGFLVQVYAHSYPSEVTALVLVDPADPRLDILLRERMTASERTARDKALNNAMPQMPAPVKEEFQAMTGSMQIARGILPLPKIPVVLLTGTKKNPQFPGNPLEQDLKLQLHNDLLAKIPGSRHVLVPTSRHYIQNDAPDLVIQAIRDSVSSAASMP